MKELITCLCAALMLAAAPAWAQISRDDAAGAAQRASGGGRVLSVERSEAGRRAVWRVKLVTPRGEVRVIMIDAQTGQAM